MIHYREAKSSDVFHAVSFRVITKPFHNRPESIKELMFGLIADMDWIELSACKGGHTKDSAKPTALIVVEETVAPAAELIRQKRAVVELVI